MNDVKGDIGALATEAMNLLIDVVEQTPAESWDQPSNLEGWSLRELVGHALGSATKIVTLVEGGKIWGRSEPPDWVSEDPAARLRGLAARLQEVLPGADLDAPRVSPAGEVPLHRALAFPISDVALHSWDLHRSQGRFIELPENLLMFCQGLVESIPGEVLRRPGAFGAAQPAPESATPTAQLMAHLGRSVSRGTDRARLLSGAAPTARQGIPTNCGRVSVVSMSQTSSGGIQNRSRRGPRRGTLAAWPTLIGGPCWARSPSGWRRP